MNEQALRDAFNLFTEEGYNGTFDDYKELIKTNENALNDSYGLFKNTGYNGSQDDFSALMGLKTAKTQDSATADPTVESQNNTGSKSGVISGESLLADSEDGADATDYYKKRSAELKQSIAATEKQLKAYEAKGGKIDPRDAKALEEYKNELAALDPTDKSFGELSMNALENIVPGLKASWENTKTMAVDFLATVAGDDAVDFLTGGNNGPIVFIDPDTGSEVSYKNNPERFRELNTAQMNSEPVEAIYEKSKKPVGEVAEDFMIKQFDKVAKINETMQQTGSIVKGIQEGNPAEFFSGVVDGVTSLITTMVPAVLTRGASLFPQVTAPMYSEYNLEKAKNLYPESDNPIEDLVRDNKTELTVPVALGTLAYGLEKVGLKGITKQMVGKVGKFAPIANLLFTQNKEGLTEYAQFGVENINKELGKGLSFSDATIKGLESLLTADAVDAYLKGVAGAGVTAGVPTIRRALISKPSTLKEINDNVKILGDLQVAKGKAGNKALRESIDLQIAEVEGKLKDLFVENNKISEVFTTEQAKEVASIVDQKKKNNRLLDELKSAYDRGEIQLGQYGLGKAGLVNKNNKLTKDLSNVIDTAKETAFTKYEDSAKDLATKLDFKEGPQVFETTEAYLEAIAKAEGITLEKAKELAEGSDGAFIGKGKIFIDKTVAKQTGAVTVASHEMLHPILNALVGDKYKQGEYVNEFKKSMSREQRRWVEAQLEKNVDESQWDTEYINYFSDGILRGEIKYNESVFKKLGDFIVKLFKGQGFENISFDSGRDVYNFLKEYNTSQQKTGKVSDKAVKAIKTAEEKTGTKVAEVDRAGSSQFSKTLTDEQTTTVKDQILKIQETAKEGKEIAAKFGKEFMKSGKQERLEQKVLATVKPVIDKIVTNRTKALYDPIAPDQKRNVSREDYQDSMRSDLQTMLVNEYNGSQDVEKFLVNRGYLRANDLAKRLGIETTIKASLDAVDSEGKETIQVASDYNPETTMTEIRSEENRKKKLVDPRKILGPQRSKDYKEIVGDRIAEMGEGAFEGMSFAKLKDMAPEVTADWWRTTVKKVITPAANLATKEIPHMQRLIIKHADMFIAMLPEGAILEGETAREDLIGTGVGVPRKLQQAFYNKGERTSKGAGLIPFNLKPEITKADFLATFAINPDETLIKINGKDPRSQAILALIRLYGQVTTNSTVRELANLTGEQKADIRAGAAKIQFSQTQSIADALDNRTDPNVLLNIQFSLSARDRYLVELEKARPDLDPAIAVEDLFEWADTLNVKPNKLSKYKKLALYWMKNGYLILPEDGYKVTEAIKLSENKKFDPYAFKNPDQLLQKYIKEPTAKLTDPTKVKTFTLAKGVPEGHSIQIFDVEDSREAQKDVREVVDTHFGKKADPWCIIARQKAPDMNDFMDFEDVYEADDPMNPLNQADVLGLNKVTDELSEAWNNWVEYGDSQRQIAFQNGKLVGFFANDQWWDRMDRPTDKLTLKKKTTGSKFSEIVEFNGYNKSKEYTTVGYIKGDINGFFEKLDVNKNLVEKNDEKGSTEVNYYKELSEYKNFVKGIDAEGNMENHFYLPIFERGPDGVPIHSWQFKGTDKEARALIAEGKMEIFEKKINFAAKEGGRLISWEDANGDVLTLNLANEVYSYKGRTFKYVADILNNKDLFDNETAQIGIEWYANNKFTKVDANQKGEFKLEDPILEAYLTPKGQKLNKGANIQFSNSKSYADTTVDDKTYISIGRHLGLDKFDPWLANKRKGEQDFDLKKALKMADHRNVLAEMIPFELGEILGLSRPLTANFYRIDGFGFKFDKEGALKRLMVNGKPSTNAQMKAYIIKVGEDYAAKLKSKAGETKLSETSIALKEKIFGTGGLYEQSKNKLWISNPSLNSDKVANLKGLVSGKASDKDIQNRLNLLSQSNELNTSIANLYISIMRDFINLSDKESGMTAIQRKHLIGQILASNSDIVNSFRSLSTIDQVITSSDVKDGYRLEHVNAMINVIKSVAMQVANPDMTIDFKSTAKLVPNSIVKLRDKDYNSRTSDGTNLENIIDKKLEFKKYKSFVPFQLSKTKSDEGDSQLNKDFNTIIEGVTGIARSREISEAKSRVLGRNKGKFKFFIPPSADDFAGLMYSLLGKGKQGDINQKWFKDNLFDPFGKAIMEFESYKENGSKIVNNLKKSITGVPSDLKKVNATGFTNEDSLRIYLWAKAGYEIPGTTDADVKEAVKIVSENPRLKEFAERLKAELITYPEPQESWQAGTITIDVINMINTTKRAEFLAEWQENADAIFTKDNLNKLRAAFGDNYVEALLDMLYRMKTGRNRPSGANKMTNKMMNWVNDAVGTIMFFNTRSSVLQTLSTVNFINWSDNNPLMAAKAFANQKQYWTDFAMLFNSDFLKQRRSGLKNDINADDIASAAETTSNKAQAVLASLLKMGFLPTQIADSFAIAAGGASFVRNRFNAIKKANPKMTTEAAMEQAFLDFQEIAEETQQSSRPDRISQQQASPLGRIILAFANTSMQYARLSKKAFLDLKNGRGDAKTNITKIAYYAFVQNLIFSSLQAALFATLFDDEEDENLLEDKKYRTANTMLDSILRGVGVYGAAVATIKNVVIEINKQEGKDRPDHTQSALRALSFSPPLDSKMRKLMSAGRAFSYKTTRDQMDKGLSFDNPAIYAGAQIVSASTNIPLDRIVRKAENIKVAVSGEAKMWQSIMLSLGFSQWDLGMVEKNKKKALKKSKSKWKKKQWK